MSYLHLMISTVQTAQAFSGKTWTAYIGLHNKRKLNNVRFTGVALSKQHLLSRSCGKLELAHTATYTSATKQDQSTILSSEWPVLSFKGWYPFSFKWNWKTISFTKSPKCIKIKPPCCKHICVNSRCKQAYQF